MADQKPSHTCTRGRTCRCSMLALEPNEDCPVHGFGEWPPRCEVCGKFLPWPVRHQGAA